MKVKNIIVVYTQEEKHIHTWETGSHNLNFDSMLEAVCCTGLVDETKNIDFEIYDDTKIEDVLLSKGTFTPSMINFN